MQITLYSYSQESGLRVDTKVDDRSKNGHTAVFNQEFLEQALFFSDEGENDFIKVVSLEDTDQFAIELEVKARVEADMVSVIRGEEYPVVHYLRSVLSICRNFSSNKEQEIEFGGIGEKSHNIFLRDMKAIREALNMNLSEIESYSQGRKEARG